MRIIQIKSQKKIAKAISYIESKIKINIAQNKGQLTLTGTELTEFVVDKIIQAIDFGFDADDAVLLKNEDYSLEFVNMKDHTHRRNLKDIRARVIGRDGKAKKTIETITGSVLVVNSNMVGIIADAEHLQATIQGVISLVQGSKHANVFTYLEKQNANNRGLEDGDLGLRDPKKDLL